MNIDRINGSNISAFYKKTQNETVQTKNNNTVAKDNITLSESGKIFNHALKAVRDEMDVREAKVNQISKQIKNGEYKVNSADIASKMIPNSYFSK